MQIRSIIVIILVWLVVMVVRQRIEKSKAARDSKQSDSKPEPTPEKLAADTIQCAHCGTYIPQREAVKVEDHYYCNDKHARLGRK